VTKERYCDVHVDDIMLICIKMFYYFPKSYLDKLESLYLRLSVLLFPVCLSKYMHWVKTLHEDNNNIAVWVFGRTGHTAPGEILTTD